MYELSPLENAQIRLDALLARRATRADLEARQAKRLAAHLEFVTRQSLAYKSSVPPNHRNAMLAVGSSVTSGPKWRE